MSKIRKLSEYEARKIAAGEVVERPTNIVKELVENSIDALSSSITIYLEQADNKISCIDDLDSLTTLGFRGEALSSISAISKVELITKQEETLHGTYIV